MLLADSLTEKVSIAHDELWLISDSGDRVHKGKPGWDVSEIDILRLQPTAKLKRYCFLNKSAAAMLMTSWVMYVCSDI